MIIPVTINPDAGMAHVEVDGFDGNIEAAIAAVEAITSQDAGRRDALLGQAITLHNLLEQFGIDPERFNSNNDPNQVRPGR